MVAISGSTALQGLRDRGRVAPEQKVLVIGASGSVGTFATQIARAFGAQDGNYKPKDEGETYFPALTRSMLDQGRNS